MTKVTKLTLEEMIRRKEQILEAKKIPKKQELYIESLDGSITITEPTRADIIDAQGFDDAAQADPYLLLQIVEDPPLKKLAKEYGCDEPTDIVDIIFKAGEVGKISQAAMKLAGFDENTVKPVKGIKN